MSFDKTKAMRNAEKYLSQGKIRAAIGEYEQVVKHDTRDIGTLNMLGDLYSKNSDVTSAILCYVAVADHYGNQGFFQKAIAVYNKISRLDPESVNVWQKLAELHKKKGSPGEAKQHYQRVADHFEKSGRRIEALAVWKEIAQLDPTNTDAYLSLAESYINENQLDDAFDAFTEVARRLAAKDRHDEAVAAIEKALVIRKDDTAALRIFVDSQAALGCANVAAERLAAILLESPHSREVISLLADAHIAAGQIDEAEKTVIRLVELDPANFPRLLELGKIYVEAGDASSAARVLSMSSEHLLVGGQAEEFDSLVTALLERDPANLEGLRLKSRYCSWQRDEDALCRSLERLASAARDAGAVEDERFALQQLAGLRPQETEFAERLRELNAEHGFDEVEGTESLFDKRFLKGPAASFDAHPEEYTAPGEAPPVEYHYNVEAVSVDAGSEPVEEVTGGFAVVEPEAAAPEPEVAAEPAAREPADDSVLPQLQKEIESVRFYIEAGYLELAEKASFELKNDYGDRREIAELIDEIRSLAALLNGDVETEGAAADDAVTETAETASETVPETAAASAPEPEAEAEAEPEPEPEMAGAAYDLAELRSELGLDDANGSANGDFETYFNTGTAYKEMGLVEEAIKEFQAAAAAVGPNDGTRRFFACANLLGFCFMEQKMPGAALTWFERALETAELSREEKQGIWYELAMAYEEDGNFESAGRYFEMVYSEDANFRDVSEKLKSLSVNH
ncbi:MAG: tetratricopeptide repeat protein [Chloracidobacterium sp.]|nr:tetratricopeptide repeat protein [Chloracidobacterium sp.]